MYKKIFITTIALLIVISYGCKREDRIDHIDKNAPAPAQISSVKIEAIAGGAILTYKIPLDPNLAYVKAVYEIRPGVYREAKSSIYMDTLSLVGYGDTKSHEVKIFSIGKNEKASEAVSVNVTPLTPPVVTAFEDLDLVAAFGGVKVRFKNKSQAKLAIRVIVDSLGNGNWTPVTTFYTGALEGAFSVRGLKTVPKKYAVFLMDRWENKSDTLSKVLTPLFEELISKKSFSVLRLPTDTYTSASADVPLEKIYDGVIGWLGLYASYNGSPQPQWFTLDLGQKVVLSRFKAHQLESEHLYSSGVVKSFEMWGSNSPDTDGGWNNWELLGKFDSFKPSGLPLGQTNQDDYNYGYLNGEDFEFETVGSAVRYIRFKSLSTYSSSGQIVISELTFFGKVQ